MAVVRNDKRCELKTKVKTWSEKGGSDGSKYEGPAVAALSSRRVTNSRRRCCSLTLDEVDRQLQALPWRARGRSRTDGPEADDETDFTVIQSKRPIRD